MDHLEIVVGISPKSGNIDETVVAEVSINGRPFVPDDLAADMTALAATLDGAGEYFVVTCQCGDPGCAGMQTGVQVAEGAGEVSWTIRDWGGRERPGAEYRFDSEQYRAEIQRALRSFLDLMTSQSQLDTTPYLARDGMNSAVKAGKVERWLKGAS